MNRVAGGSRLVERRPAALHAGRREGVPCGTNVMTLKYASSRVLSMLDWCRGAGQRATAASELRAGDVNARRPRGTRGRSAALVAESVDVAEHSATLDGAMDGGLSAGSEGGLRTALQAVHMPRVNPDEMCRQNPRVIHSASQLACARVRAADRDDVGHAAHCHQQRRRRRARDGVNDPPIAHRGTLRVRGMGSFTPSLVLYSRRCSPCRAA